MRTNQFTSMLLVVIAGLLMVLAFRPLREPPSVQAAKTYRYEVINVTEGMAPIELQKRSQGGWELVAATFWNTGGGGGAGLMFFRK